MFFDWKTKNKHLRAHKLPAHLALPWALGHLEQTLMFFGDAIAPNIRTWVVVGCCSRSEIDQNSAHTFTSRTAVIWRLCQDRELRPAWLFWMRRLITVERLGSISGSKRSTACRETPVSAAKHISEWDHSHCVYIYFLLQAPNLLTHFRMRFGYSWKWSASTNLVFIRHLKLVRLFYYTLYSRNEN